MTRLPRVRVETRAALPGWALRVVAALLPALLLLSALARTGLWADGDAPATGPSETAVGAVLVAAAGLTLSMLRWPTAWQPLAAILGTVVLLAFAPHGQWWALVLAVLGYAGYRLAVLAADVPWSARVEWAVLARIARTDAVIVGGTLLVGTIGLALEGDVPYLLLVGAVAVLGLGWWLRRLSTRADDAASAGP